MDFGICVVIENGPASNMSVFSLDLQTLTFGDVVAVRHYEKA